MTTSNNPDEIRADIERTRAEFGRDVDALAEIDVLVAAPDMRGDIRVNTGAAASASADAWWVDGPAVDADLDAAAATHIRIDAPRLDGRIFVASASNATTDIWLG